MKQHSIIGALFRRTVAGMLFLWLLVSVFITFQLAGDIRAQTAPRYAAALEKALDDLAERFMAQPVGAGDLEFSLPEVRFMPSAGLPLLNMRDVPLWKGTINMNGKGAIMKSDGLDLTGMVIGNVGLTINEGKLSVSNPSDSVSQLGRKVPSSQLVFFLTFLDDPMRSGSFPSAEISGDYTGDRKQQNLPVIITSPAPMTPPEIMDGIDSGELHFDSVRLRQSSCLRGRWLEDGKGEKTCFVIGAYGWSPLLEAIHALSSVYLLSFVIFQLMGAAIWLSIRHSIVRPLKQLERALKAEPLKVSNAEYDFQVPYGEIRGPIAAYLRRWQMQRASAAMGDSQGPRAEDCPLLLPWLQRCEDKLMPILIDRGQKTRRELRTDGYVAATPDQLEDVLLALFREVIDYADPGNEMFIRTMESSGFLLTEIEVKARHVKEMAYEQLWDGIYRSPADGDAPGAKLRKAMWRLPGSFATVRKTKKGLALTLGLPKGA